MEPGSVILITIVGVIIMVIILAIKINADKRTEAEKKEQNYLSTKDQTMSTEKAKYERYLSEYKKKKEAALGTVKKHFEGVVYNFYRTSGDELVIVQEHPPTEPEDDSTKHTVSSAYEGKFEEIFRFSISQIMYWRIIGDVHYTSKVEGGGSQVNISGAVAGGIIAGGAGAIIGSQMGNGGVQPIKTTTQTHDDRKIEIRMRDGRSMDFYQSRDFAGFKACIPEKEYDFVVLSNQQINNAASSKNLGSGQALLNDVAKIKKEKADAPNIPDKTENTRATIQNNQIVSAADEILKYKNLLDIGAISEEEYAAKKKELLSL